MPRFTLARCRPFRFIPRSARCRLATALAVVGGIAGSAHADFQFSDQRTTITVNGVDYDRVTFFARNDGTGYTAGGTGLLGMDIVVASTGTLRFETGHVPDTWDYVNGVDVLTETDPGVDIALRAPHAALLAGQLTATKLMAEIFDERVFTGIPQTPSSNSKNGFDPVAAYANLKQFGAVGVALGANHAVPAGTAPGAAFACVVTSVGATVTVSGQIGGDSGTAGPVGAASAAAAPVYRPYTYTAVVPEPTAALTAAAGWILMSRRSRRRSRTI